MPRRFFAILFLLAILGLLGLALIGIPSLAIRAYGPPSRNLDLWRTLKYSARLLWYDGLLTQPGDIYAPEQSFAVEPGESVASISARLQQAGIIRDAAAFRDYLIYTGLDTSVQAGKY